MNLYSSKSTRLFFIILFLGIVFKSTHALISPSQSSDNQLKQYSEKDSSRVDSLNNAALKLHTIDIDKLKAHAEEAYVIADAIGYVKGKARSVNLIGIYHYKKPDYPKALDYYRQSMSLYRGIGDDKGIVNCLNNIGVVYMYQGIYSKALDYFHESFRIFEELGNKRGAAKSYNNIGNIYRNIDDYDKALENYQKSLKVMTELNDSIAMSQVYNNIGITHKNLKDYPQALDYYQRSLSLTQALGRKASEAKAYNNIGNIYSDSKDYPRALDYYRKALKLSIETKRKATEAYAHSNMGQLYLDQKKYVKAHVYCKRAFEMAREIDHAKLLIKTSSLLSECSMALGLYRDAYATLLVNRLMSDSLFNEKNLKKKIDIEYQYIYEKEKQVQELERQKIVSINKQQKIILYLFIVGFILMSLLILVVLRSFIRKRKANRILAVQKERIEIKNKKLNELNATKDKFFSIIAHDLKSPFNVILSLTELLLDNHDDFDECETHEMIKSLNISSKDAFRLLENLLTWSRAQTGKMAYLPEKLNLRTVVLETIGVLQGQANIKDIQIRNRIQDRDFIFADKNMLSTIFRNLISNAIKFTPQGGEILIDANKVVGENEQNFTRISVKDNGVGISKEMQAKLFDITENSSTEGTENETGTGLGLILCEEFIKKHQGGIFVESEKGKGSKFVFTIPSPS